MSVVTCQGNYSENAGTVRCFLLRVMQMCLRHHVRSLAGDCERQVVLLGE
jgi:hypothetical protein